MQKMKIDISSLPSDAAVRVYNHRYQELYKLDLADREGDGVIELDLPNGLYSIRTLWGEKFKDALISHNQAGITHKAPRLSPESSVPISGYWSSHEYFTESAKKLSRDLSVPRFVGKEQGNKSKIMIFLRTKNAQRAQDIDVSRMWNDLVILDSDLSPLNDLNQHVQYEESGWSGISFECASSNYYLRDKKTGRTCLIPAWKDWRSHVFIPYVQRPVLESRRLVNSRLRDGFMPDDEMICAGDVACAAMLSGFRKIPAREMKILLNGKFENPMAGLLAAHLLIRRENPNWELLCCVIERLQGLIGENNVDLQVLKWKYEQRVKNNSYEFKATEMPILSSSFQFLIEASYENEGCIPKDSKLNEKLSLVLKDSMWADWSYQMDVLGVDTEVPPDTSLILDHYTGFILSEYEDKEYFPKLREIQNTVGRLLLPKSVADQLVDRIQLRASIEDSIKASMEVSEGIDTERA